MNNSKPEKQINPFIICIAIFLAFTLAVAFFDVKKIGYENSYVGFASLNGFIHSILSGSQFSFLVSEIIGYFALIIALIVAFVSVWNFYKSRSLLRMNKSYLCTCILYGTVVVCYILFEVIVINYRPIALEASYPSSHTMLALCIFYSAIELFKDSKYKVLSKIVFGALMALMVILRLASGVHWFTDIVGAILLSITLISGYKVLLNYLSD